MIDAVRDILIGRQQPQLGEVATQFAHAAEILHTATRSWPVLPPTTRAELDAVTNQTEGLRRALIDMRSTLQK